RSPRLAPRHPFLRHHSEARAITTATRRKTSLTLDATALDSARALGIDLSAVEASLARCA
ncbi:hypothetical protein E2L05_19455, partial [Meridianimarinicoccus aquatilis]